MLNFFEIYWQLIAVVLILLLSPLKKVQAEESIPVDTPHQNTNSLSEINQYAQLDSAPINSVNQLADVQPTDWAFKALQSLVERYGCLSGYPNVSFQGNRTITRFEFAAALNTCIEKVTEPLSADIVDLVTQEDLMTVQKLKTEFNTELATLRGRVDALEARTQKLEQQKFPLKTKLNGQMIVAVADTFGDANRSGNRDDSHLTFSSRLRLNIDTSFTGNPNVDRLRFRVQTSNVVNPVSPGNETRSSFQSGSDTDNNGSISKLEYSYKISDRQFPDKWKILVGTGFNTYFDDWDVINPLRDDGESAISRYGRYSPIFRLGGDTGLGVTYRLSENFKLETAYLASNTNNPSSGLFNGKYGLMTQLIYYPDPGCKKNEQCKINEDKVTKIAFTYVNAYGVNGLGHNTGSLAANLGGRKVASNSYGIETNVVVSDGFHFGGWLSYTDARTFSGDVQGDADIWSWAVTLAFPDLGKKGDLGGIIIGMQPKLTGASPELSGLPRRDPDTGFHIEAFYRYQISKNLSITPGVIWLTAPNHNEQNGDIFLGVVRTTFKI